MHNVYIFKIVVIVSTKIKEAVWKCSRMLYVNYCTKVIKDRVTASPQMLAICLS